MEGLPVRANLFSFALTGAVYLHKEFLKQTAAIFEVLMVHCIIGAENGGY